MQVVFLTQVQGVLKPIAWVLGEILNAIYNFVELFGIENIALCIILFTFVVKMLMLPLTIKQQKFTKLQSKMSPELSKIQQKYKGKKDEESLRRQQSETQAVYAKYGASPMGGCLPLLISLPIMFALYRVIYAIPAYVTDVQDLYGAIADKVTGFADYKDTLINFMNANGLTLTRQSGCSAEVIDIANSIEVSRTNLIDIFSKFSSNNWHSFLFEKSIIVQEVNEAKETISHEFTNIFCTGGLSSMDVFVNGVSYTVAEIRDKIISVNSLFGLSILDRPEIKSISVVIPVLAVATQFIQGKLQTAVNSNKKVADDPAQQTTKMMSTIMPIMSGAFCLMLPIGVGIYWIASAVFTIIQTLFINKYLDKINVDDMLEKSKEKNMKRQEKLGVTYDNKMAEVAKTKALNYNNSSSDYDNTSYKKNSGKKTKQAGSDYKRSSVSYSSKSIAANANLLSGKNSARKEEPKNTEIVSTENTNENTTDSSN